MFEWLFDINAWLTLGTLAILEIILGIDNIIILTVIVSRLPQHQQNMARRIGLLGAMAMRLGLLASIAWIARLTGTLFIVLGQAISGRDLILFSGGVFLIWKAYKEIKSMIFDHSEEEKLKLNMTFVGAIIQIMLLDIVFSLDSVITAVGLSDHLMIMMLAIILAIAMMMLAAKPIGDFVEAHPTVKMLALAFLILVGIVLILESLDVHVPKGYMYFAMFFSLGVEALSFWRNKNLERTSESLLSDDYKKQI